MLEEIIERYEDEEFLTADGFDSAIIGVDDKSMRLIYSKKKILEILQSPEHGMDVLDSIEYYDFNIVGAYMGEKTPIYMETEFE
tara:strand:+ start:263 stop:514 length:252 start_codon:yes stop_codon:yes gene_type:complete